ncbi:hypothetical protein FRB94_005575 [Tulasnella sp. JGI-2019a]|nr:hypothetical protein FRB94_005575 [Tulasnella sp. JGI-2019a]
MMSRRILPANAYGMSRRCLDRLTGSHLFSRLRIGALLLSHNITRIVHGGIKRRVDGVGSAPFPSVLPDDKRNLEFLAKLQISEPMTSKMGYFPDFCELYIQYCASNRPIHPDTLPGVANCAHLLPASLYLKTHDLNAITILINCSPGASSYIRIVLFLPPATTELSRTNRGRSVSSDSLRTIPTLHSGLCGTLLKHL